MGTQIYYSDNLWGEFFEVSFSVIELNSIIYIIY